MKPIRSVVLGIPNVGKSTLINKFAKRKVMKTGNEAAVTKKQQILEIDKNFYVIDTPGIMIQKAENEEHAFKIAVLGAIRDTAMDYISTAHFLVQFLKDEYPNAKHSYCNIFKASKNFEEIFVQIGKKIGKNQLHQISEKIIQDFRKGKIGRISLEKP